MILDSDAAARAWFAGRTDFNSLAVERLARLESLLREENARQNLVSTSSLQEVWVRHFADSAQLLDHVPREIRAPRWLDLGAGAGFPGLVVSICRPSASVVLVESRAKRIVWLEEVIRALELGSVRVLGSRLELVESFPVDIISARAFAPLRRLVALSARFSTPQTRWLLPKGRRGSQELAEMPNSLRSMFHVERSITDPESVILVGRGAPHRAGRA